MKKKRETCDCFPWNPSHEPEPTCSFPDCTADATGLMRHRKAKPFVCDHLICDTHKTDARAVLEHDFVPLHVAYPKHFAAPAGSTP